jgi:hypothetical protein
VSSLTAAKLEAATEVLAGYKNLLDRNLFLGFGVDDTPRWSTLANAKEALECTTYGDVLAKEGNLYAHFHCVEGDYAWAAYYFNGAWRVGSSADRLQLRTA